MDAFENLVSQQHFDGARQQHYVPRFYLAGFTKNNQLSVFDRRTGRIRLQTPERTARVPHLYTFEDDQNRNRYDIDKLFAYLEDNVAPIIARLGAGVKIGNDELGPLTEYLAFSALRTPAAIAEAKAVYAGLEKAQAHVRFRDVPSALQELKSTKVPFDNDADRLETADQLVKKVREDTYNVEVDEKFAIKKSLEKYKSVAEAMYQRDWMFLYTKDATESFLTTDSPVVLASVSSSMRHRPIGYGSAHAQILCPLTHNCALVMSGDKGRFGKSEIAKEALARFNKTIALDCHRYVFGRDHQLIHQITDELKLTKKEWRPKTQVSIRRRVTASNEWDVFVMRTGD